MLSRITMIMSNIIPWIGFLWRWMVVTLATNDTGDYTIATLLKHGKGTYIITAVQNEDQGQVDLNVLSKICYFTPQRFKTNYLLFNQIPSFPLPSPHSKRILSVAGNLSKIFTLGWFSSARTKSVAPENHSVLRTYFISCVCYAFGSRTNSVWIRKDMEWLILWHIINLKS